MRGPNMAGPSTSEPYREPFSKEVPLVQHSPSGPHDPSEILQIPILITLEGVFY